MKAITLDSAHVDAALIDGFAEPTVVLTVIIRRTPTERVQFEPMAMSPEHALKLAAALRTKAHEAKRLRPKQPGAHRQH